MKVLSVVFWFKDFAVIFTEENFFARQATSLSRLIAGFLRQKL